MTSEEAAEAEDEAEEAADERQARVDAVLKVGSSEREGGGGGGGMRAYERAYLALRGWLARRPRAAETGADKSV